MGMSNGEANAFNTVTRYFLGITGHAGPVSPDQAQRALLLLREKAYKTLSAGLREEEVQVAFARHGAPRSTLVLSEVAAERARQDAKWGEQNHPDGTEDGAFFAERARLRKQLCQEHAAAGTVTWRHILDEEVHEAYTETDPAQLREELIQVAAVAVAWGEAIDRRSADDEVRRG